VPRLPKLLLPPARAFASSTATSANPAAKALASAIKRENGVVPLQSVGLRKTYRPLMGCLTYIVTKFSDTATDRYA
jgi:hypothetical protein